MQSEIDDAIAYNLCPHCRAIGVKWKDYKIKTEQVWDADIKGYWDKDYYQCPQCQQEITNIASIDAIGTSLDVDDLGVVDEVLKTITELPDRYPPGQWFLAGTTTTDNTVVSDDPSKIILDLGFDIRDNELHELHACIVTVSLDSLLTEKQRLERATVTLRLQKILSQYREGWNLGLCLVAKTDEMSHYQIIGYQNAKESLAIGGC